MTLRHLEWLIGKPLPDPEVILYEIVPYSREDADRIIRHLRALAGLPVEQAGDDPARAERVRQAFRFIVDAAGARQATLDLDVLEKAVGKPPWRIACGICAMIAASSLPRSATGAPAVSSAGR